MTKDRDNTHRILHMKIDDLVLYTKLTTTKVLNFPERRRVALCGHFAKLTHDTEGGSTKENRV